jgi:integrase/recombinase XerC
LASSVTPEEATAWANRPDWSSSYRHGFLGTVMTAFRWAMTKRLITNNPLAGLRKPPKASRGRKALITVEEHAALVAHADADFADFLQLLWLTGSRPSEMSHLQIADVDFANAVAILGKHKTLHLGKERIIVLSAEALSILQRRLPLAQQQGGYFFLATDGRPMTAKAIGGRVRRTCKRAGIRRCIAYGYRHTFATDALSKGVPETSVAALLGHSTTAMLHKHYSHLTAKVAVLKEAMGKIR